MRIKLVFLFLLAFVGGAYAQDALYLPAPDPVYQQVEHLGYILAYAEDHEQASSSHLEDLIGLEFVLIPAGEFVMGSDHGEGDEKPPHRVRITRPFQMGKYEVTQAQWEAVMGGNPSRFKGADRPVEGVSWEDVQAFIRRLNEREGANTYRLPTEAEWEYACRAESETEYSFGDDADELGDYAWYRDNSGGQTHPVREKQPNAWELYDMHGNVGEWRQDWFGRDYYANRPDTDPPGPDSGSGRVYNMAIICPQFWTTFIPTTL